MLKLTTEEFFNYVNKGMSRQDIADELGTTLSKVRTWMKQNNISLAGRQLTSNKLQIDSSYWKTDSFDRAYWAGFIAADGCVSKDGRLEVGLAIVDKTHLQKLKKALRSEHKIEEKLANNKYLSCYFRPRDREIVDDLYFSYNIRPAKSGTYSMPEWLLQHELLGHYLRGYIDGDGCLYCGERSSVTITSGSSKFIEQLEKILMARQIVYSKSNYETYSNISISAKASVLKLLNFIYEGSTEDTRLDRKYAKYNDILNKLKV